MAVLSDHLCECGCGEYTNIAIATVVAWGHVKGVPFHFKAGHGQRHFHRMMPEKPKEQAPLCQCGCGMPVTKRRPVHGGGYPPFKVGHDRRGRPTSWYRRTGLRATHVLRAEHALGRSLPPGAQVHHADGTKNIESPLVICQDAAYHFLLHVRLRVKRAGGDPNTDRICTICKTVKPIAAFVKYTMKKQKKQKWCCLECNRRLHRAWVERKKAVA